MSEKQTPEEVYAAAIFYPRKPNPVHPIIIDGKRYHFEWSDRFGPLPMTRAGRVRDLSPNHKLWTVTSWWAQQGKRVDAAGVCIWEPKPKERVRVRPLGGRNWMILNEDAPEEPGDKWIEIDDE